jgi:hypothetical protein
MKSEDVTRQVRSTWKCVAGAFATAAIRHPGHARLFLGRDPRNRRFALAVARIWLAYRLGALRYWILVFSEAADQPSTPCHTPQ